MKKLWIIFISLTILCLLCACNANKNGTINPNTFFKVDEQIESTDITEEAPLIEDTYESALTSFIEQLSNAQYEDMLNSLQIQDNSIVTSDDLKLYLERTDWNKFINNKNITVAKYNKNKDLISTTLTNSSDYIDVLFDYFNGQYTPRLDFYKLTEMRAPGHCEVTVNGTLLNNDWISRENEFGDVIYSFWAPKTDLGTTVKSSFGTYTMNAVWLDNANGYSVLFNNEGLNHDIVLSSFKGTMNEILEDVFDGKHYTEDFKQYFVEGTNNEIISQSIDFAKLAITEDEKTSPYIDDVRLAENGSQIIIGDNSVYYDLYFALHCQNDNEGVWNASFVMEQVGGKWMLKNVSFYKDQIVYFSHDWN